jgi:hypothetical protein
MDAMTAPTIDDRPATGEMEFSPSSGGSGLEHAPDVIKDP